MTEVKIQGQQTILSDKSHTGKIRPWREKKIGNQLLAMAYEDVNRRKAARLRECACYLIFRKLVDGMKLQEMNSCRVRLCPMCAWRRSLKIYSHVRRIMDGMETERDYRYIFLTLTVRTCHGVDLQNTIDGMMSAWQRLVRLMPVRRAVKGWYRGLEITHDVNERITQELFEKKKKYYKGMGLTVGDANPNYDLYHPHFHCVLAVNSRYFKTDEYITHEKWVELWRKSMRLDYDPLVDIRRVSGNTAKDVAEAAKYAVKDGDYIVPDDWDLTVETVRLLDRVLENRRLVAYGGKFKEWHKKLNLDDEMDGDLIHVDDEEDADAKEKPEIVTYVWNVGYNQYLRANE